MPDPLTQQLDTIEQRKAVWVIRIPAIPKDAAYDGPPQADLIKMQTATMGDVLGHLMLSANPECKQALLELEQNSHDLFRLLRKVRQMQTALVQASGVMKLLDTQGRAGVDVALQDIQTALVPLED